MLQHIGCGSDLCRKVLQDLHILLHAEYRKLRDEAQELVIAENNLKSLFAAVGSEVQHQQGQREEAAKQIHAHDLSHRRINEGADGLSDL